MPTDVSLFLRSDPTGWLLEPENPSVRYFALKDLMGRSCESGEVRQARSDLMTTGAVAEILNRQEPGGHWGDPKRFYTAKYQGTVWQLIILAEMGADPAHPQVAQACEFILENSQERESGGFSAYRSEKGGGGLPSYVIPCLTGNMVWSLIRLGYLHDERIQKGIGWINRIQRFDDGDTCPPKEPPYERFEMCWGKHSCHMGVVKVLKALAEIPQDQRSPQTVQTIERAVGYLLAHHIYKKSHDLESVAKPGWLKLGFPLMYQSDVLEVLDILTRLGVHDPRMQDAVDIVRSKQDEQGRWKLENSFNGKFLVNIEKKGASSKWITLRALRVLK